MIKRFLAAGCLALAGFGIHSAGAHPHHHGPGRTAYGVEKVTTFEMGGCPTSSGTPIFAACSVAS